VQLIISQAAMSSCLKALIDAKCLAGPMLACGAVYSPLGSFLLTNLSAYALYLFLPFIFSRPRVRAADTGPNEHLCV